MSQLLVLDCHYLCHRAFHSFRDFSFKDRPTGVIFGFLKEISHLKDMFQTDRIAFCFEGAGSYRTDIFPAYKQRRSTQEKTEEEKAQYKELGIQIKKLRTDYLPKIGFKNIFSSPGLESDDVMAAIALEADKSNPVTLVTSDQDLLQCLSPYVSIYSPTLRETVTEESFAQKYQIRPSQWAVVKAIAGCHSDGVRGIPGIGEISALKYLRGELKEESHSYQSIRSAEGRAVVRRNRKLVQLPYPGTKTPTIADDSVTKRAWLDVCESLGMRSLAGHPPIATRNLRKL